MFIIMTVKRHLMFKQYSLMMTVMTLIIMMTMTILDKQCFQSTAQNFYRVITIKLDCN